MKDVTFPSRNWCERSIIIDHHHSGELLSHSYSDLGSILTSDAVEFACSRCDCGVLRFRPTFQKHAHWYIKWFLGDNGNMGRIKSGISANGYLMVSSDSLSQRCRFHAIWPNTWSPKVYDMNSIWYLKWQFTPHIYVQHFTQFKSWASLFRFSDWPFQPRRICSPPVYG